MNKSVLISIRPRWIEKIARGEKTIEVRKTRPKLNPPFKCYIYQTLPKSGDWNEMDGHVIGEFVCSEIDVYDYYYCTHPEIGMDYDGGDNWFCIDDADLKKACMTYKEFRQYAGNKDVYGWHITDLVIYGKPRVLSSFSSPDLISAWEEYAACEERFGTLMDVVPPDRFHYRIKRPPQSWCYVV